MKIIYFLFFILFINNVYGFGISPTVFDIELNNGETIEKEFFILNDKEYKLFNVSSYGIDFFNFSNFYLEVDKGTEKEVKFLIKAPYDIISGNYEGRIYVKEIKNTEGGLSLEPLLGIKVNINVISNFSEDNERTNIYLKDDDQQIKDYLNYDSQIIDEATNKPEIFLFYSLIGLIFTIGFYFVLNKFFKD